MLLIFPKKFLFETFSNKIFKFQLIRETIDIYVNFTVRFFVLMQGSLRHLFEIFPRYFVQKIIFRYQRENYYYQELTNMLTEYRYTKKMFNQLIK